MRSYQGNSIALYSIQSDMVAKSIRHQGEALVDKTKCVHPANFEPFTAAGSAVCLLQNSVFVGFICGIGQPGTETTNPVSIAPCWCSLLRCRHLRLVTGVNLHNHGNRGSCNVVSSRQCALYLPRVALFIPHVSSHVFWRMSFIQR